MGLIEFLLNIIAFLNNSVIPFLMALAFLIFIYNIFRYFILGSSKAGNKEKGIASGQENAKRTALWGIIALVIILSFWGIVNVLTMDLGFDGSSVLLPDYIEGGGGSSGFGVGSGTGSGGGSGTGAESSCKAKGGTWECIGSDPVQQYCHCTITSSR